jgi:hypothetical protein
VTTSLTAAQKRHYDIHGVGVEIRATESAVLDAIELRLCDFGPEPRNGGEVRLKYENPPPDAVGTRGRAVYDTPHGSLFYEPETDALTGTLAGVTLRCEAGTGVASIRCAEFSCRNLYLATHPLTTICLMELLERRGRFSLHAGCLASREGGGVLIAGPSGAGKSTLTLALARSGLAFLSDDVVFLTAASTTGEVRVLGFADTIGIGPNAGELFPELQGLASEPPADGFPKRLHRIEELFGERAIAACRPRAIVFPFVAPERPSAIDELDAGEALLRLVPDVLLTHSESTQAHLAAIGGLLNQVRCYTLCSGHDLERAAELVRGLL